MTISSIYFRKHLWDRSVICHELNQPLQVINGRIEILSVVNKDDQTLKTLEIMKNQVHKIGAITKKTNGIKKVFKP
jgi:hypothetical protein